MNDYLIKHKQCECKHFESDHEGFYWFHCTACKVKDCPCQKFRKLREATFEEIYESGGKEGCLMDWENYNA